MTALSPAFESSLTDFLRQSLAQVADLPRTRESAKIVALDIADKVVRWTQTTDWTLDDHAVGLLRDIVDREFETWYALLMKAIGLTNLETETVDWSEAVIPAEGEFMAAGEDFSEFGESRERDFGLSPAVVLAIVELVRVTRGRAEPLTAKRAGWSRTENPGGSLPISC